MLPDRSVFIGQKLIEKAKVENSNAVCGQTVLPERTFLGQNWQTQMRHFGWFSNIVDFDKSKHKRRENSNETF